MKKYINISASTDPIKGYQAIYEYSKEMQGIADFLHCDIMDGQFVDNRTYDAQLVSNINQNSLIMLDVHLMVDEPLAKLDDYLKAGANILTIHYEAFKDKGDIMLALEKIKNANALAGISIKPHTKLADLKLYLHNFDVILVMSVEPGASGQKFMPEALERVKELDAIRSANNFSYKIEVDGGINPEIASQLVAAGADMLVSGNYLYKASDKAKAIESLRG